MNRQNNSIQQNQQGLVSIIVTLIIMLVIALIVFGFARLTRREQRQSLDRQLSTQAYYAAETAVNDTIKKLAETGPTAVNQNLDYTTNCSQFITTYLSAALSQIDGAGGVVSYPCLFVDPSPSSLEFGSIEINDSTVIPLEVKGGGPLGKVLVSWQDKGGGSNLAGCASSTPSQLPTASSWNCDTGILRVDIVPLPATFSNDYLVDNTMTVFLYPSNSNAADTEEPYASYVGFGNQGKIIGVNCTASNPGPKICNFKFTGLGANRYVMRLKSIYRSSAATLSSDNGGGSQELIGSQTLIDATGKANDVLRRIQVRIPTTTTDSDFPEAALESVGNICKRFELAPPDSYTPDIGIYPECDVISP